MKRKEREQKRRKEILKKRKERSDRVEPLFLVKVNKYKKVFK